MGKCETVTASIGIKFLLSDIILQINGTNFNLIMEMLKKGFIEDDNDFFNQVYQEILYEIDDDIKSNYSDVKEYLTNEFKSKGSLHKNRYTNESEHTLDFGCLFNKHLLVPVKKILDTGRWGYDRYGINCSSRPMDFDLSVDIEKYKYIEKYEIAFLLVQDSG